MRALRCAVVIMRWRTPRIFLRYYYARGGKGERLKHVMSERCARGARSGNDHFAFSPPRLYYYARAARTTAIRRSAHVPPVAHARHAVMSHRRRHAEMKEFACASPLPLARARCCKSSVRRAARRQQGGTRVRADGHAAMPRALRFRRWWYAAAVRARLYM